MEKNYNIRIKKLTVHDFKMEISVSGSLIEETLLGKDIFNKLGGYSEKK